MNFILQSEKDSIRDFIKNPWLYAAFVMCFSIIFFANIPTVEIPIYFLVCFILTLIAFIDSKYYIIPDILQVGLFLSANILILVGDNHPLISSYAGGGFAYALFGSVYFFYDRVVGKEAIGLGDVKLFANAGLLLGFINFSGFLMTLTAISIVFLIFRTLIFRSKENMFPYAPLICPALWICLLFGTQISAVIQYGFERLIMYVV